MALPLWQICVAVTLLTLLEGVFSGSEIALLSADKLRLKSEARKGSHGAKLALELALHPEKILSSTLLMTSLCMISTSAIVAFAVIAAGYAHAELISVLISSPIIVLFGEMVPKTLYQRYATRIAPLVAYPVSWAYWGFFPVTRIVASYTKTLSRLLGPIEEMMTGKRKTTREELRSLLSAGKAETEIKLSEKRMIKRIFDFKDTEAQHALIPLVKVDAIEQTATVAEALESFKKHRHSRVPVYSDRIDNIVGLLETSDLFSASDAKTSIKALIGPAHYAAETQSLEDVMVEMRDRETEMVVVVDEYGGAVGVLTFEDIIEEIVGEINDEYDSTKLPYQELGIDRWVIQARAEIKLLNEHLNLELPEGDYETLSGFLLQQFGRIPARGDELFFDTPSASLKFTVRQSTERAIERVLIERTLR